MLSHLFYYQIALLALLWLFVMLHLPWPRRSATTTTTPATTLKPKHTASRRPKPFEGLTHRPPCPLCRAISPALPHRRLRLRRPHAPDPPAPSHGGHLQAFLSPYGLSLSRLARAGRICAPMVILAAALGGKCYCTACEGYFPGDHGTLFHGKRMSVELIVHVLACLAEGLGIRGTARVFEVDPNTVLGWLVEAADQLQAFSTYFLHATYTSARCSWTNSTPCFMPSRPVKPVKPRRLSALSVRPTGCGSDGP